MGAPPPATYKGLVCTPAGWAGEATFAYSWPDAEAKARAAVRFVRQRAEAAGGAGVEEWCEEYFGAGAFHGPAYEVDRADATAAGWEPPEVIGRLAWRAADPESAGRGGPGVGVLGLSGPPMIAGIRPDPGREADPAARPRGRSPSTGTSSTAGWRSTSRRPELTPATARVPVTALIAHGRGVSAVTRCAAYVRRAALRLRPRRHLRPPPPAAAVGRIRLGYIPMGREVVPRTSAASSTARASPSC